MVALIERESDGRGRWVGMVGERLKSGSSSSIQSSRVSSRMVSRSWDEALELSRLLESLLELMIPSGKSSSSRLELSDVPQPPPSESLIENSLPESHPLPEELVQELEDDEVEEVEEVEEIEEEDEESTRLG